MTVKELLAELTAMVARGEIAEDADVITDGCDCTGEVQRVTVEDNRNLHPEGRTGQFAFLQRPGSP